MFLSKLTPLRSPGENAEAVRSAWSKHHIRRFSTLLLKLRLILKREYGVLEGLAKVPLQQPWP